MKSFGRCGNEDHFGLPRARPRASGSGERRLWVVRATIDVGAGAEGVSGPRTDPRGITDAREAGTKPTDFWPWRSQWSC